MSTPSSADANGSENDQSPVAQANADILRALPQWLQPGVSPGVHFGLQIVLLCLNVLLLICVVLRVFSPHFEIMFLLSLALTGCYFVFMAEIGKIHNLAHANDQGANNRTSDSEPDRKNK